jgi:hypothetical protein
MKLVRGIALSIVVAGTMLQMSPAAGDLGSTQLLSASPTGQPEEGGAIGGSLSISADGTVVAFPARSDAIVPGDANGQEDIIVFDLSTGSRELATVSSGGQQADSGTYDVVLSADGRFVAFSSGADNLVPGDTNHAYDVFVHDRITGSTRRVSLSSDGAQGNDYSFIADVSADGRFVLFSSYSSDLVAGDTNGWSDVFLRDRQLGTTRRVSLGSGGSQPNGSSGGATINADATVVAFWSDASNLVPGDSNDLADVFVRDLSTGAVTRADVSSSGDQANGTGYLGRASLDDTGALVAFESDASNLVPGDANRTIDAFVHDMTTGRTELASVRSGSRPADGGRAPILSGDGQVVSFMSSANDLTAGIPLSILRSGYQMFVHDRSTGGTVHVSVDSEGRNLTLDDEWGALDATGRRIAFMSLIGGSGGFIAGRVYLHDRTPQDPGGPTILGGPSPVFARGFAATDDTVGVRVRTWAHDEQGVCSYAVERSLGGGTFLPVPTSDPTLWLAKSSLVVGADGRFRVRATDCVGDAADPRIGPREGLTIVQENGAGVLTSPGWTVQSDPGFIGDARSASAVAGASIRFSFTADGFAWIAERGPDQGRAQVFVDGEPARYARLWADSSRAPRIVFARDWRVAGQHQVRIVVVGTQDHPWVNIDAFALLNPVG